MSPTANTTHNKTSQNQPSSSWEIFLFVLLVCAGVVTAFVICSDLFDWSVGVKSVILQIYIIVAVFGWFAYSSSMGMSEFQRQLAIVCGVSFPVIGLVMTMHMTFFWITLIVFVILGIYSALNKADAKTEWDTFIVSIYAAWIIVGIVVTVGSTRFLPYAESAIDLANIHIFLNIRFVVTALLIIALVGKALVDAFNGPPIKISPLQSITLSSGVDDSASPFSALLKALLVVLDAVLSVIQKLTNGVWYVMALLAIFIYRTGINLGNHVVDLVKNGGVWIGIFRVVLTYIVIIAFALMTTASSERITSYLNNDTSIFVVSMGDLGTFLLATFLFSIAMGFVVLECVIWKLGESPLFRSAFGGAMLLVGYALSGYVLYLFGKIDTLHIRGFQTMGLYSLLMLFAVGSVFIYQISKRAVFKKT